MGDTRRIIVNEIDKLFIVSESYFKWVFHTSSLVLNKAKLPFDSFFNSISTFVGYLMSKPSA